MLYRFREVQAIEAGLVKPEEKRPYLAFRVNNVFQAEKWRRHVIRDISKNVSKIHDGSLPENQIRDINDEINKLLREKGHWETRIKELGGTDYFKTGPKMLDEDGKEIPGNKGYKYFGRARDLPGVRELLVKDQPSGKKKTRHSLNKNVDSDYYGYRDEDPDGELLEYEERVTLNQIELLKTSNNLALTDSESSSIHTSSDSELD
ncbi:Pre-mRNA-splicing factor ISY1-like protein [Smittium culicis]|uniref:Pre-mRNA-splicing factor ISY1-like protein n=1 Tax=Smittium culicis TaxID=133412 RepID=A0A1R1YKN5_9FUNG|nr:Pre-mRNA-splicing factor ISY1-like protein [Smittium culicis]